MTNTQPRLPKSILSNADFDEMDWHDVHIHAIAINQKYFTVTFNIDYIVKWVIADPCTKILNFWISPATLVFANAGELNVRISSDAIDISIFEISRLDARRLPGATVGTWLWTIKCNEGVISFRASGYTQYFRRQPIYSTSQRLESDVRGGESFNTSDC